MGTQAILSGISLFTAWIALLVQPALCLAAPWDLTASDVEGRISDISSTAAVALLLILVMVLAVRTHRRANSAWGEPEPKYRTVANLSCDWESWTASDGRLLYVSPACERITGYRPGEFIEQPSLLREMILPEDRRLWDEHRHDVHAEQPSRETEFRIRRHDGSIRWINHACRTVTDERGEYLGVQSCNRDVTHLHEAQEALQRSEEQCRAFIALSTEGISLWEVDGPIPTTLAEDEQIERFYWHARLAECNDVFARMYGMGTAGEMLGARLGDILTPTETENIEFLRSFIRSGYNVKSCETYGYDQLRNRHSFRTGMVGRCVDGRLVEAWSIQHDMTDLARLHRQVRRADDEWQTTFDSIADPIMILDRGFRILRANPAAAAFLNVAPVAIPGKHCYTLMHGKDSPVPLCPVRAMMKTGIHTETELYDEKRKAWFLVSADPLPGPEGEVAGAVHTVKNITESKITRDAIRDSEAFNRSILASLNDRIAIIDGNGVILAVNAAWERFAAENDTSSPPRVGVGINYLDVCHRAVQTRDDLAEQALRGIRSVLNGRKESFSLEYPCDALSEKRWFAMRVMPFKRAGGGAVICHADVTERKRAEDEARRRMIELAHVTRVATLGELAASLAHEINQPLTAILSNAQAAQHFLAREVPETDEIRQILDDIIEDDKRVSEVIRRMRSLLKKGAASHERVNIHDAVLESVALIESASLLNGLSITTEFDAGMPIVCADPVQLQQVLFNLMVNAAGAMKNTPNPSRKIRIGTLLRDERTVQLSVTDSGTGIDEAVMAHLFEPFVTTKPGGMGMGLSISQTIIKAHGGTIGAKNNPEGGATFFFSLPLDKESRS
ncbi:PAS domain-containing sensor histidine kinase [Syntrophobacter fumaroxidans]|uniref:histidine kinase n=1 Tax=Syntrophobacter fumaroxidans (strain DSM 10017 / MPOB) TaxID=335543 RepID=A0LGT6_SYNFM|nr:PAS domain S-box protein [Syntrophobacter fumaroxidans]ABK16638.1 multi-sensor signal transduction histidine kinase [Syntrophobacter fumaroxidans MPOB]